MRAREDAQRELHRLRAAVDNVLDAIVIIDAAATLQFSNRAAEEMLGASRPELGAPAIGIVHPDDQTEVILALAELESRPGEAGRAEFRVNTRTGWTWVEAAATNLLHDPAVAGIVVSFRNLTHVRALEELARSDPLTGLANRAALEQRLAEELQNTATTGRPLAVLFVDLDDFKLVNDTLGHRVGDELLVLVAARLRGLAREHDVMARFGGDEFVLLVPGAGLGIAAEVAERVLEALGAPFALAGTEVNVSASIGIAVHTPGTTVGEGDLLRDADVAMYAAKASRGGARLFTSDLRETMLEGLRLPGELRAALSGRAAPGDAGAFGVAFEPVRSLTDDGLAAVAVLAIWDHPRLGPLRSAGFRTAASRARVLDAVHRQTVVAAGRARRELDASDLPHVPVIVELDARLLGWRDLVAATLDALGEAEARARGVHFELDVAALPATIDTNGLRALQELRTAGFGIGIGNVGSPSAPLELLGRLSVDWLGLGAGLLDAPTALLVGLSRLADALGIGTMAHGVSTVAQRRLLEVAGCRWGRGPLLGPVSADLATALSTHQVALDGATEIDLRLDDVLGTALDRAQ